MSQINVSKLSNENDDGAPDIVGVSTFSATSYFVPPKGTTAQRPENPQGGDLRFNTDTASLEYFRGDTLGWSQIEMTSPDLDGGARGMFAGGQTPSLSDRVDYITISTFGDAIDFGNLQAPKQRMGVTSDSTRLVTGGGYTTNFENEMDFFTMSSKGTVTDFGNLTRSNNRLTAFADSTRGCWAGGNPSTNVIDYATIQSAGNAQDFGDFQGFGRRGTGSEGISNAHGGL